MLYDIMISNLKEVMFVVLCVILHFCLCMVMIQELHDCTTIRMLLCVYTF